MSAGIRKALLWPGYPLTAALTRPMAGKAQLAIASEAFFDAPPAAGPTYWALLHLNGANASTTIVNSGTGGAWTAGGAAALTTSAPKFGSAAADLRTVARLESASSITLAGDFTVAFWGKREGYTGKLFCIGIEGAAGAMNLDTFVNNLNLNTTAGGTIIGNTSAPFGQPGDGWRFGLVQRASGVIRLAVEDGSGQVQSIGTAADTNTYAGKIMFGDKYVAGGAPEGGDGNFYHDEILVLDGQALFTTFPFAAPTAEFSPPSGGNVYSCGAADAATLSDAAGATGAFVVSAADTVAPADNAASALSAPASASDAVVAADQAASAAALAAAASDAATPGDTASVQAVLPVSAADAAAAADAASATGVFSRTASDAVSTTDSSSASLVGLASSSDAITATDSASAVGVFVRSATDAVNPTDAAMIDTAGGVSATDTVNASDAAAVTAVMQAGATDAVVAADSSLVALTRSASATDGVAAADMGTAAAVINQSASDGVTLSDAAAAQAVISVIALETLVLVDFSFSSRSISVSAFDSIITGDLALLVSGYIFMRNHRTYEVPEEDRAFVVAEEDRTYVVPEENRTFIVNNALGED